MPAVASHRHRLLRLGLALLTCVSIGTTRAAAPDDDGGPDTRHWWPAAVTASLDRAGARRTVWEDTLRRVPVEHRAALAFLLEHMPTRDLAALEPEYVLENIALAYAARDAVPWGRDVPEAIFLNDVLPYANVSERRDPWRAEFKARFLPMVADCSTPAEAAHRLNQRVFPDLGVKYSTTRKRADQSPAESIDSGIASCTGLSILLTDACRAVGVPARVAGIPSWVNKPGNHTWVEIWDGGAWHYAGAAEPDERGLNHAWFGGDASLARRDEPEHAIYAISYRRTGLEFPLAFDPEAESVPAINVTDRYARRDARPDDETRLLVTVVDRTGTRIAVAVTVRDPADATATFTGVSRDETFDTNDLLHFTITRRGRYEVTARHEDHVASTSFEAAAPELTVRFIVGANGIEVESSR